MGNGGRDGEGESRQVGAATRGVAVHGRVVDRLGHHLAGLPEPAGTTLDPRAIGDRLGASRTAVREALRVLQAKGMITARPHVGTHVRPVDEWDLTDPDVIGWLARGPGAQPLWRELFELRIAIEPIAARLAAERSRREGGALLARLADRMRDAALAGDTAAYTRADEAFHRTLLTRSGNRVFAQFTSSIIAMLQAQCELVLSVREVSEESRTLHTRLARAVAAGYPGAAERHARTLLAGVAERVLDTLGRGSTAQG